jgi:hypothetical protein
MFITHEKRGNLSKQTEKILAPSKKPPGNKLKALIYKEITAKKCKLVMSESDDSWLKKFKKRKIKKLIIKPGKGPIVYIQKFSEAELFFETPDTAAPIGP